MFFSKKKGSLSISVENYAINYSLKYKHATSKVLGSIPTVFTYITKYYR